VRAQSDVFGKWLELMLSVSGGILPDDLAQMLCPSAHAVAVLDEAQRMKPEGSFGLLCHAVVVWESQIFGK
jgi:hypothetical protein